MNRTKSIARLYARNEDGSLIIFGLFTFVIIMVLTGIGVDIARHETLRTELQGTADRAVLAAANSSSTDDATAVVEDYFEKAGLSSYLSTVDVESAGSGSSVTVTVDASFSTYFLHFAGLDTLELNTYSTAEQGMTELEVALVLDVSGSMGNDDKLTNLATAGAEFAETVFDNSEEDSATISVIPYATQVNVGSIIASQFSLEDSHDSSYCFNFTEDDFSSNTVDLITDDDPESYVQTANFDPWYYNDTYVYADAELSMVVCNPDENNQVLPFSTTYTEVSDKIAGLTDDGNTSIDVGVKWGMTFLDPSFQDVTTELIAQGEIDASNAGRPVEYSDTALKVMVVMTDGTHTSQFYIPDEYRSGESDIYIDADTDRVSFAADYEECTTTTSTSSGRRGRTTSTTTCEDVDGYYAPYDEEYYDAPYGGWDDVRLLDWSEVWDRYTIKSHAYMRYDESGDSDDYYDWIDYTYAYVDDDDKDDRLSDACDAAKAEGIIIFTIGFEAPDDAEEILEDCASSSSHYIDVDGLDVTDAFAAIATKITELRLVE
ncbi:pilus assembly protein TadG-related protein [Pacificibacter sp. AS14]|uniref:pilus assembly protein TadG-related protein n=1 Tax=Pacificibacter sp. AS14 TaxID=3135785 RepID=UPI00316B9783